KCRARSCSSPTTCARSRSTELRVLALDQLEHDEALGLGEAGRDAGVARGAPRLPVLARPPRREDEHVPVVVGVAHGLAGDVAGAMDGLAPQRAHLPVERLLGSRLEPAFDQHPDHAPPSAIGAQGDASRRQSSGVAVEATTSRNGGVAPGWGTLPSGSVPVTATTIVLWSTW